MARNIRAYCVEKGLSKLKLAALADTAPNCIAMIKGERSFPTDVIFKKIAAVLDRRPQEAVLAELAE